MKFEKNGTVIEVGNPNTFNVFEREGFKRIEEKAEKPKKDHKEE